LGKGSWTNRFLTKGLRNTHKGQLYLKIPDWCILHYPPPPPTLQSFGRSLADYCRCDVFHSKSVWFRVPIDTGILYFINCPIQHTTHYRKSTKMGEGGKNHLVGRGQTLVGAGLVRKRHKSAALGHLGIVVASSSSSFSRSNGRPLKKIFYPNFQAWYA